MSDDLCGKCSKIVFVMEALHAENQAYHKTCFKCEKCKKQLNSGGYHLTANGEIYCKVHAPSIKVVKGSGLVYDGSNEKGNPGSRTVSRHTSQENMVQLPLKLPKQKKIHVSGPIMYGLEEDLSGEQSKQALLEQHLKDPQHTLSVKKRVDSINYVVRAQDGSKGYSTDVLNSSTSVLTVQSPTGFSSPRSVEPKSRRITVEKRELTTNNLPKQPNPGLTTALASPTSINAPGLKGTPSIDIASLHNKLESSTTTSTVTSPRTPSILEGIAQRKAPEVPGSEHKSSEINRSATLRKTPDVLGKKKSEALNSSHSPTAAATFNQADDVGMIRKPSDAGTIVPSSNGRKKVSATLPSVAVAWKQTEKASPLKVEFENEEGDGAGTSAVLATLTSSRSDAYPTQPSFAAEVISAPRKEDVLSPIPTTKHSQNDEKASGVFSPLNSGEPVIIDRKYREPTSRKSIELISKPVELNLLPDATLSTGPTSQRTTSYVLPNSDSSNTASFSQDILAENKRIVSELIDELIEPKASGSQAYTKSTELLTKFPGEDSSGLIVREKSEPLISNSHRMRSNTGEVMGKNNENNSKSQNNLSVAIKRSTINQHAKSSSKILIDDSPKKVGGHFRNGYKENILSPSYDNIMSKNIEEEKRAEYTYKQYQKVKQSSIQITRCCAQLLNIGQDSRIELLQEFVSYFRMVRDSLRKLIDLTTAVVANLDLRRNGVDMLKFEILMTTEFLLGNGTSTNVEEFKKLMSQMNINIDTVMKKYQPACKMMVKSMTGYEEESCFDNPYFIASEVSYETITLEHVLESQYFRQNFVGRDHLTFYGALDKWGPVIISILKDEISDDAKVGAEIFKVIVRFKDAPERRQTLHATQVKKSILGRKPSVKLILQLLDKDINFSKLKQKDTDRHVEARLITLDEFRYRPKYKFGLVLCKPGQTTDNEYLSNCEGNPAYETFLDALATRTKLNGFKGFVGGLDTVYDKTGTDFLYTKWKNFEVMFHCSTLLPYKKDDPQQIERKRHIGNDIVNVIFLDGDMQFDPTSIKTQFTHVYILIKAETVQNENEAPIKGYRLAITSSTDVPKFGPPLSNPPVFTDLTLLRNFLMAKLINAENAALKAPKFSKPNDRARHALFDSILEEFSSKEKASTSRLTIEREEVQTTQNENEPSSIIRMFSTKCSSTKKKFLGFSGSMNDLSNTSAAGPRSGARFSLIPLMMQKTYGSKEALNSGQVSTAPLKKLKSHFMVPLVDTPSNADG